MTVIDHAALGANGPSVSRLCLGTMMFGDQTEAAEAADIIAAFKAAGGNFIDTADAYAAGASERIVGDAIRKDRGGWIVATKVGNPVDGKAADLSAAYVLKACDASLERLQTPWIDLYYLHKDDEETPLQETMEALATLFDQGKIKAWGFSNHRGWKIAEMVRLADRIGLDRPVAAQPYYHALYRSAEVDYLPACQHFGVGVVPYSPLARGLLTGKYAGGSPPAGSRAARGDKRILETEFRPEMIAAADQIVARAKATGRTSIGFALGWNLANKIVSSVLIGPRRMTHFDGYLSGFAEAGAFNAGDEALVAALVPTGGVLGMGYSDPRYPFRGRDVEL